MNTPTPFENGPSGREQWIQLNHDANNFDFAALGAITMARMVLEKGNIVEAMRWTAASQRSLILSSAIRRKQSVTANELQLKETSCTGTIIDLLDQAGAMFPANTLNLEINTGTSEAAISTVSLGRIIINLAKNVFDHALPPISFSVQVIEFQTPTFFQHPPNAITSGTYWELMCEDSGPGIHPDVLKNIPNATTKSGPGHAMGIKNILEIAQLAGGGMSMESTHPGFTKVRVFIPVLSDGQAALHMAA